MAERLREGLRGIADCGGSTTQIVPVILGSNARALDVASRLQDAGFDIRAIRYPTVPEGEARLRIAVNAGHNEATIDSLVEALKNAVAACGVA
jgi:8-amino-7-oxononanoate synthase